MHRSRGSNSSLFSPSETDDPCSRIERETPPPQERGEANPTSKSDPLQRCNLFAALQGRPPGRASWHWNCVRTVMTRTLQLLLGVVCAVCLAGCQGVGEKEAQLEFERLRQRTITPKGDRLQPNLGMETSSEEA